ncbi:Chitin-inducible gibberellin-responsive protein 2 [Acorus gramineus]|uniref:Chitin-inducible gibberellin-responsive protein 2 n=1 Tax=Acorus gramineus TaxID=55184 RepID=A0AAV9BE32_ACOGR|nr:Chitin-inducible gibberellin-responsive protein 2 [Acorus gramineus]
MDPHCIPHNIQSLDHVFSDDGSHTKNITFQGQHFTLDSSSGTCYPVSNSPSTLSISPNGGSPTSQHDISYPSYDSPINGSCVTEDKINLKHKLRELEMAMLIDDVPLRDLKQVLIACARAVAENDLYMSGYLIENLREMVSVTGEPIQRLGAYLLEGLIARLSSSGSAIYKALKCKEPSSSELLSYMHIYYEVCPFFKFGYMSANGAIAEAVRNEDRVHIIDFQIAQGSQWVTLIQALSARPGGPPKIRITGIDNADSAYARGGGLHLVGQRLSRFAESCKVPFEFHGLDMSGCEVKLEHLKIRPGEALAVNFAFQLHHMPDESVSTENHRDRLLRLVKGLSPTVVTLVEQESNINTSPFLFRFMETLDYYTAIFESIDATFPRDHKDRISLEQHCVARDIVNIIACEGAERVERHELLGKWRSRFTMAGFSQYPLSSVVNATIKRLLEQYNENYRLEERDGALYLGWKSRALVVSCAWR